MPTLPSPRAVAEFSDRLLAHDLPGLPTDRRAEVVDFAARRIAALPSPMRLGVGVVAATTSGFGRLAGPSRVVRFAARRPLPVLGEYVRLVRSLAYAYVWETWPDTAPDGTPP
jgi:hypothetical protein